MGQHPITLEEILRSAEQLSNNELNQLSQKIIEIQAEHKADKIPLMEILLLEKIKTKLPLEITERFNFLKVKLLNETIKEQEHIEYLDLIEITELDNAEKVKHLGALALLRNTSLEELGKELEVFNYG